MTMCFLLRAMLKMLKIQVQIFGIITKLIVLRTNGEAQIRCIFCDTVLTGGRAILAQKKANVGSCIPICKKG